MSEAGTFEEEKLAYTGSMKPKQLHAWFNRFWLWGSLLFCISGLLAGSFLDLQIDTNLFDPTALWALFFQVYGPVPLHICWICAGWLLFFYDQKVPETMRWLTRLMGIVLIGFSLIYQLKESSVLHWPLLLNLVLIFLLSVVPAYLIFKRMEKIYPGQYRYWIIFLIFFPLATLIVVNIIKVIWCRPRFFVLLLDDRIPFCNWYQINWGIMKQFWQWSTLNPDFFRSFPSAHTSSASCILILWLACLKQNNTKRIPLLFLCWGWIGMTAFSRMVLGAHFLSDVSFGFLIGIFCLVIVEKILEKWMKIDNLTF